MSGTRHPFLSGIVSGFLRGQMPILLIVGAVIAGLIALRVTPREEEPQIVVPLADVLISYPGGSAAEVEQRVSSRLERLLYQIDGVEYVYSMSRPGQAVVTARFFVGEDREESLVKLYNKIHSNMDRMTPGIAGWVIKPIEIDDVPIVNATLWSNRYDTHDLYRVAEEVVGELQRIPRTGRIEIHGGEARQLRVLLRPERLAAYHLSALDIAAALRASNQQVDAGAVQQGGEELRVEAGPFLRNGDEVRALVVSIHEGRPVMLRDVATVVDGPAELESLSRYGRGPANADFERNGDSLPAVVISVAKQKGSNAVDVARQVRARLDELHGVVIPPEVEVSITRDYGLTANEKVNELVSSLGMAIITVVALLALTMNWRAGLIVALAVPITYSLTLLCNLLLGYTINRVTLFALILALGLLVDDPIASVENIERHLRIKKGSRFDTVVGAMDEIMPPVLMSTLAIMIAFLPMFFITGMMGPYMRPMALNVPIAVMMSTVVALTITPWLSSLLLKVKRGSGSDAEGGANPAVRRFYARLVGPFVDSRRKSRMMLVTVGVLFALSIGLALGGFVPLKMLPFDNKNEFQVLIDLPESATMEQTDAVAREIEFFVRTLPEVESYTVHVGTPSPMDFNGMVRHYYMRHGPNLGDVRVNLVHRDNRVMGSHALVLSLRREMAAIAERTGAVLKVVEVPPGPPVLSTLVAEVYGVPGMEYGKLVEAAARLETMMADEEGVVDLDDTVESVQTKWRFDVDRDKAARNGISVADVARTLHLAVSGLEAGVIHDDREQNELAIVLRLPRSERSRLESLSALPIRGRSGNMVQLGELGSFEEDVVDRAIHHKNQRRVVYVTSEVAGRGPAYAVLGLQKRLKREPLPDGIQVNWAGEGEWKITLDVFRDLGIAFSIALLGIYVLLVYETGSFLLPVVIMLSIPLTMIGIMPGFWLLNALGGATVGGYDNLIFFTATAMIGMIALCGIVVRNAIVLIDFIRTAEAEGVPLRTAILDSGAVRLRPIVLTAGTTLLGTWPITFDPIFSGLAWSIIFGLLVSTVFTLLVIPVVYNLMYGKKVVREATVKMSEPL